MKVRPIPPAALILFVVTAVPGILQFMFPSLLATFSRDPSKIASGEWWRLGTSLVFQDGGVIGTLFNLAGLAVLGVLAERALGPARMLALYLAGAVAGQAAGLWFGTTGAGNSIAVCGLAGGLVVASATFRADRLIAASATSRADRLAASVAALWAFVLVTTAVTHSAAGIVTSAVAVVAGTQIVVHRDRLPRWAFLLVALGVGAGLSAVSNLHGPALLGGMAAGAVLTRVWSTRPELPAVG
ncbi:hypothetical protein Psi02_39500 [Planotetraspora silvatica]|uniref:Peptidase S54 rhomboid domain-containing protein n=1 Tax=Planotetraspora silvatica TaxID=234614 RepID=A0A8J3XPL0_9ACTN|nr:rhomboid family intramembrane serine protease [Planotetraspora silvatica]GII47526.1 hypothetical protein Psi02_39500 [Planotetraspora silvatica]